MLPIYVVLFLAIVIFFASVKICAQYQRAVVFLLGRYVRTAGPGLFFLSRWSNGAARSTCAP